MYTYTWYQWLAFFYIYCFFGWIFESAYVSFRKRRFVNRGFLRLPLLPLYGSGAVMMLWVSLPVKDSLPLVYISGFIAATALEYVTGYVMEMLFKVRYWDYSDQKFQLHGYICLSSSIAWGFLTILMTEVIHRPIADAVLAANPASLFFSLFILSVLFAVDAYESTKEALALGKALEAMTKMKEEIEELQAKIAVLKEEAADRTALARDEAEERMASMRLEAEKRMTSIRLEAEERITSMRLEAEERMASIRQETGERITSMRQETGERITSMRQETEERMASIRQEAEERITSMRLDAEERMASMREERREKLTAAKSETAERLAYLTSRLETVRAKRRSLHIRTGLRHYYRRGLLKGNPSAASSRFSAALKELREMMEEK